MLAVRIERKAHLVSQLSLLPAFNFWRRSRGLLGRTCPALAQGIWIKPCNAVHCWFMGYSIDVLFFAADGRLLKIVEQLRPWRMAACRHAHSVVELAAGEVRRLGIQVGDELTCVD